MVCSDLVCVDPSRIDEFWPHVKPMLQAATEQCGDWSLLDIRAALDSFALLWIACSDAGIEAAAVTQLIQTKNGLACHAVACGGSGEQWVQHLAEIEKYAKEEGCSVIRIEGREGWRRVFKDYKLAWITLEKRIS